MLLVLLLSSYGTGEAAASFHLTLKDALQSVDTINFQVMMANARLEQAIARISQAQSDLLPHVDGVVSGAVRPAICALRAYRSRSRVSARMWGHIIPLMPVPV